MKKYLALLLVLALLVGLCACAKTEAPAEAAAESEPTTETTAPAAEAEAEAAPAESAEEPAPAEPEAPAEDAAPANTGMELVTDSETAGTGVSTAWEIAVPENPISYPIGDGSDTVTMWYVFDGISFTQKYEKVTDYPSMVYMTEKTGVRLETVEVTNSASTEQYNLMIAAGDYLDMLPTNLYTGDAAQAYVDEVIIDLTDLLPDNAPNFWAQLQTYSKAEQYNGTTDGMWLTVPSINLDTVSDAGYFTRGDWLKELGLETPSCMSEFMNMLYAYRDAYGCEYSILLEPSCSVNWANSWFDVGIYALGNSELSMYLKDGKVACGLNQDNYRTYLEWLRDLYADGMIHPEFYVSEADPQTTNAIIGAGGTGFWSGNADHMGDYAGFSDDPDFELLCLPKQPSDDGILYETPVNAVGGNGTGGGGGGSTPSISVDCADPAFVVQWLNYFYTEEGFLFANYGIPEECWNYDDNGNIVYTDLILNNPEGFNSMQTLNAYGWSTTGTASIASRFLDTYDEATREGIKLWSDTTNVRYDQEIPTAAALDADESNSVISQTVDICAYADEIILKWVVGNAELNDESWAEYCDMLSGYGIDEVVSVYQKAYDDYCAEFGE